MNSIKKHVVVGFFTGLLGGVLAAVFVVALYGGAKSSVLTGSDAISVANTYIVFTTIIFVAITLVLTVTGFLFTQQFSASKELQMSHLMDELEEKFANNVDDVGIKLIDKAFANPDVSRHIQQKLETKLQQLLSQCKDDAKNQQEAAEKLASRLK